MNRAYTLLEIKSVDDDQRIIEGIASTPTPDRTGDVVEPKGAKFNLPLPLLYQHNSRQPIGTVVAASVTDDGIAIKAQFAATGVAPFIDEAWALIKAGLVRGLSIGFRAIDSEQIKNTFSQRFKTWEWLELSAVTVPANSEASMTMIKSLDQQQRAASGAYVVRLDKPPPGATGTQTKPAASRFFFDPSKGKDMTYAEQISAFEAKRAASVARRDEVQGKAAAENRTKDESEREEFANLSTEIDSIDAELKDLRVMEKQISATATPVNAEAGKGTVEQKGSVVWGKSQLPPGTAFTRYARALMIGKGNLMQAHEISKQWKDSTPEVEIFLKAAVAAGTTTDATWAGPLVYATNMVSEFVEFLRPMTVVGRIQGLRLIPFNVSIPRQTAGASAGWVGQGLSKPVSKLDFDRISMVRTKIAVIVAFTDELARDSNPSAEAIIRMDLAAAIAKYLDGQFLNPDVTASGTTSPASITNGITAIPMSGTTIAAVDTDVRGVLNQFITANAEMMAPVWIMHPRTALYLSELRTTNDIYVYPDIGMKGGTFKGFPVITSQNMPIDTGADTWIVLLDANEILLAQEGVQLDTSGEASIQMSDAPSSGAQSLVSLWQNNMVGVRAEQYVNYKRRRDAGAVGLIENVSY